jgi:hypothetical protein
MAIDSLTNCGWGALLCSALIISSSGAPQQLHADTKGSWQVELEGRADSMEKGKIDYRLTAEQVLVPPDWKPILTVSTETLTYPQTAGSPQKTIMIKYLNCYTTFETPNLTCDTIIVSLLPPTDTRDIAAKPTVKFRADFLAPGLTFQIKIPRGLHYITGSGHSSRVSGLMPGQSPRAFVRSPQYVALKDKNTPHLLSILLPVPAARVPGTGYDAPYGIEFTLAPD